MVGHDRGVTDLGPADRAAALRLREAFLDAGFTADGLLTMLGASAYAALGRGERVPARRALQDRHGAEAELARLFVLGDGSERGDVARHLPLDDLLALGLVGGGSTLRALVDVRPYGESDTDWYVVSDHGPDSAGRGSDSGAAAWPARWRWTTCSGSGGPRSPSRVSRRAPRCGGRWTSARAAACRRCTSTGTPTGSSRPTATGARSGSRRSPRHCRGRTWDLREGSMFEPVSGELFDLVVSNPPFVISPGHRYTYRDAGLPADDLGASS